MAALKEKDKVVGSFEDKVVQDGGYITAACKANLAPGRGIVGMVSQTGRSEFHPEVRKLTPKKFIRKAIARQCCIKSIAFLAMPGGEVLELCSTIGWDSMPSLDDADEKEDIPDPNQALIARIVVLEKEVAALKIAQAEAKEMAITVKSDACESTTGESTQSSVNEESGKRTPEEVRRLRDLGIERLNG